MAFDCLLCTGKDTKNLGEGSTTSPGLVTPDSWGKNVGGCRLLEVVAVVRAYAGAVAGALDVGAPDSELVTDGSRSR